ncbi:MAG: hypothetical protein WBV94_02845 [Blastocatellia bacterium]
MTTRISRTSLLGLGLIMMIAVSVPRSIARAESRPQKDEASTKEVFTGAAVAIGGQFGGRSRTFTLEITGHTPDAEAQQDLQILQTQGQEALMKAIGKTKLGFFAFEGQVGRDLNYVQETETEDGRKITVLFERWLKMFEARNGTRSEDYPFTYVELFINDRGKGEGSLIGAARVYMDKRHTGTLDVENFGTYPARLMGVELRK